MDEQARALLVLWHHQTSRQFVPVARLTISSDAGHQLFELSYVRGYERARDLGFVPFVAFPRTDRAYRSDTLFPFFRNRVLQRSRPDYTEHVRALGLVAPFDTVDVLSRNDGRRETDHVEVVPAPRFDPVTDAYNVHFWVRGIRHVAGAEDAIGGLAPGDLLICVADPQDQVNPKALLLCTRTGRSVGYLPDYLAFDVHSLIEQRPADVTIRVERVNSPPIPPQRRVLCRVDARCPPGFKPLDADEFQPLERAAGGHGARAA
jgi:hypothetical protein